MMSAEAGSPRLLIAGVSTRALASSAAGAGYRVTAVDAFADLDLRRIAEVIAMRPDHGAPYSAIAAAVAAQDTAAELVAYTSNFENYPAAVDILTRGRQLLGNRSAVLRRVRDPVRLMRILGRQGFATPQTRATSPGEPTSGSWLLKPRRSGGGHGVAIWQYGQRVPRTHYLQERIDGVPGSVVFAADGRRAVQLGVSRQLVGDEHFSASGYRYCGSLLGPLALLFPDAEPLREATARLAAAVTEEFGLVGLNGIDFIARDGVPYPIEVNPRYSASMELVERTKGLSIFGVHLEASQGRLPAPTEDPAGVEGKAIVFARRAVTMGQTRRWLDDHSFADLPHPGEKIPRGRPICTVFAGGSDAASCYRLLARRAAGVYRCTRLGRRRAA
jgi:predicted ATP-grasp superfamily ATP-dependent carboligase